MNSIPILQTIPASTESIQNTFMAKKEGGISPQEKIKSRIESGEIDIEKLKSRIEDQFGEEIVAELFDEDGTINFDKLSEIRRPRLNDNPPHQEFLNTKFESGEFDLEKSKSKIANRFGEEVAQNVFGDDGSINFDKLMELLSTGRNELFYNSRGNNVRNELSELINLVI